MGNATSVAQDPSEQSPPPAAPGPDAAAAARLAVEDACCAELLGAVPLGHQRVATVDGRWFAVFRVAPHNTVGAVELLTVDPPTTSAMALELPAIQDLNIPTADAPSSRTCTPNELRTIILEGMRRGAEVNVLGVTRHLAAYVG